MRAVPLPPPRDPEFQQVAAEIPLIELDHAPELYLRLVANPFLAFFALLAWFGLAGLAVRAIPEVNLRRNGPVVPVAVIVLVAGLFTVPHLLQYHCLDCGATGRLIRWRKHICPASAERRRSGRVRRFRGPTPPMQVVLWLFALAAAVGLLVVP